VGGRVTAGVGGALLALLAVVMGVGPGDLAVPATGLDSAPGGELAGLERGHDASPRTAVSWRPPEARPPLLPATAQIPHYPYDGRFTFVRIRYASGMGRGFGRGGGPPWAHDYPRGEINFLKILDETTNVVSVMEGGNVFALDDPELMKYPVAYLVEVGAWAPSPAEVEGLRHYLLKGGFLIIDDFRSGWELYNFQEHMRRVLPGHLIRELDVSHPIFDSFFHIESLDLAPPTFRGYEPAYLGIFEDDDPDERLMVMINFNNDIGEYWEYSDVGWYPIDLSNDAYKLGVNYIIYALTH
jgi:hypothetical protein